MHNVYHKACAQIARRNILRSKVFMLKYMKKRTKMCALTVL